MRGTFMKRLCVRSVAMNSERSEGSAALDDDEVTSIKAELAEAEAAEAQARAEAAEARSRAADPKRSRPGKPRWQLVALSLAALVAGACLALTGLMVAQHMRVAAQQAQDRRFVDAARDGVTALLSIDHSHAQEDVQRILDLSTGQFREDFQKSAEDFVKTAVDSKAVTKGTINAAALSSVEGDNATVLVAAISNVSNANGADQNPRPFRMAVTVTRDGDTCKMSDVEFVA